MHPQDSWQSNQLVDNSTSQTLNGHSFNPNKEWSEHLKKMNAIQSEIEAKLTGLSTDEISTLLARINSNVSKKSIFKPDLPDLPVIHGYRTL